MPRSVFKLLIPLTFLILLLFVVFKADPPKPAPKAAPTGSGDTITFDPSRFLIRPFHAEGNATALALDGGALPITHGQVPSVVIGNNILRTLHLAWVHDWSNAECRTVFKNLQAVYASEQGASLPALRIYLNPVFSDPAGEALHRAMLQVFFRSRIRENYLILASELSTGTLPPDAEAIRKRLEEIDPTLIDDWNTPLDWLENDIAQTFSTASVQQARNAAVLGPQGPAQLTSMLATLPPLASSQEIVAFLQDANTKQRAWLQTLPKPTPESAPVHPPEAEE
jgi:hypothetical protein